MHTLRLPKPTFYGLSSQVGGSTQAFYQRRCEGCFHLTSERPQVRTLLRPPIGSCWNGYFGFAFEPVMGFAGAGEPAGEPPGCLFLGSSGHIGRRLADEGTRF